MSAHELLHGDCLDVLATLVPGSVDAVVTDPPYGLAFMGKAWDHGVPGVPFWEAALRVAAPGAYLLAFGGTRTYHRMACAIEDAGWEIHDSLQWLYGSGFPKHRSKLKPAVEPIALARKPAPKASPLNIDACRIAFAGDADERESKGKNRHADYGSGARTNHVYGADHRDRSDGGNYDATGRWPANVLLDEEAASLVGEPARFFYCAKANRAERNAGCDDFEKRPLLWSAGTENPGSFQSDGTEKAARNHHPTVKPLALMRWLVRLVAPEGGLVLDPFAGSGTTGVACVHEGRSFLGIEREAEYAAIARARIAQATTQGVLGMGAA